MGTRSDIIVHRSDNTWARIYCHWDGHPEHNGTLLINHYNSQDQAEKLVALGDLSSLGQEIGQKHNFDYSSKLKHGGKRHSQLAKMCLSDSETSTEYTYVWTDGEWLVGDPDEGTQTLRSVADVLSGSVVIHSAIKAFGGNFVVRQH